jgi:predicted small lipoprotein YifL
MRRFPLIALLVLLVGVVLAGCGSDGPDGSPAEVLAAATKQTQDAKSSRVAIDVSTAGAQPVKVTGEGVFDYAGKGTLNLDLPFGENGAPARVESIIDGDTVYQKFPPELAARLPGGKQWLKYSLKDLQESQGGGAAAGTSNDPTQSLTFLRGISGEVTEVGKEDVRGDEATHYKATIDLQKAAAAAGPQKPAFDQLISQFAGTTFPADIWIDDEGRVRKMVYTADIKPSGSTAAEKATTSLELFDFGAEVTINPPPASEVTDASELLEGTKKS